jgi:hypothetical protein
MKVVTVAIEYCVVVFPLLFTALQLLLMQL